MPSLREEPGGRGVSADAPDAAPALLPANLASAKLASSVPNESNLDRPSPGRGPWTALLVRSAYFLAVGTLALVAVACATPTGSTSLLSSPSRAPLTGFEAAARPGSSFAPPVAGPIEVVPAAAELVFVAPVLGERHPPSQAAPTATEAPLPSASAVLAAPTAVPTIVPTTMPSVAPKAATSGMTAASTADTALSGKTSPSPTPAPPAPKEQRQLAASADAAPRSQPSSRGNARAAEPTPKPPSKEQLFIQAMAGPAQESQRETGVPASVTIAQAILESDWGTSRLAVEGNNYFGIKAERGPGTAGTVTLSTREVIAGQSVTVNAKFRAYESVTDSLVDHGRYFVDNKRYAKALQNRDDPKEFARQIALAGYATDPAYATKLVRLMDAYRLYDYDVAE